MAVTGASEAAPENRQSDRGLEWLLGDLGVGQFLEETWEKQPLLIYRRDPNYYSEFLSLETLDRILESTSLRAPNVRLVKNGRQSPEHAWRESDLVSPGVMHDAVADAIAGGSTLVLQFLHERWQPLAALCARVGSSLGASAQANVYVTPSESQGLTPHFDDHDVFVLQVHGHKDWKIWPEESCYLPPPELLSDGGLESPRVPREFTLWPGDLLYLPRGWVHAAYTPAGLSAHVTLGVNTLTWIHVIRRFLAHAAERDPTLRESISPPSSNLEEWRKQMSGELVSRLSTLPDLFDPKEVLDEVSVIVERAAHSPTPGRLVGIDSAAGENIPETFVLNAEVEFHKGARGKYSLVRRGKVLTTPPRFQAAIEVLEERGRFRSTEILSLLSEDEGEDLIRSMARQGLISPVES